jgi:hypothetical protein
MIVLELHPAFPAQRPAVLFQGVDTATAPLTPQQFTRPASLPLAVEWQAERTSLHDAFTACEADVARALHVLGSGTGTAAPRVTAAAAELFAVDALAAAAWRAAIADAQASGLAASTEDATTAASEAVTPGAAAAYVADSTAQAAEIAAALDRAWAEVEAAAGANLALQPVLTQLQQDVQTRQAEVRDGLARLADSRRGVESALPFATLEGIARCARDEARTHEARLTALSDAFAAAPASASVDDEEQLIDQFVRNAAAARRATLLSRRLALTTSTA